MSTQQSSHKDLYKQTDKISMSPFAAKKIRKIRQDEGLDDAIPIRLGIKGGGCSGFTYTFAFDARKSKHDLEFESEGMKIVVDRKSNVYIKGTVIDWGKGLLDGGLLFHNPQAKKSCGCNTSFMIDAVDDDVSLSTFNMSF